MPKTAPLGEPHRALVYDLVAYQDTAPTPETREGVALYRQCKRMLDDPAAEDRQFRNLLQHVKTHMEQRVLGHGTEYGPRAKALYDRVCELMQEGRI